MVEDEPEDAESIDDPAYQKAVFTQAYHQTRALLNDMPDNSIHALSRINQHRNEAVDDVAAAFALEHGAACGAGCGACCHQMVLCTPLEIFDIARRLLDTKSAAGIAKIKDRLSKRMPLPLDERSRRGADKPCVLLENNSCTIYEHRPSLCRTMLSTSRQACETSLDAQEQAVPFIAEPVVMSFLMQLGIDYALIELRKVSTEKVEMSRALSIALENFEAAFRTWIDGKEAFPDCHADLGGRPSNHDLAEMAAARSGLKHYP